VVSTPRFLDLPDGVRAERVHTSRGEFATSRSGADGPLVPGWTGSREADMAARLGVDLQVIDGAGHSPAVERPHEMVSVLTEFWGRAGRASAHATTEAQVP
jgi:pimeloyl-ACP methyl ester carboxylesterase